MMKPNAASSLKPSGLTPVESRKFFDAKPLFFRFAEPKTRGGGAIPIPKVVCNVSEPRASKLPSSPTPQGGPKWRDPPEPQMATLNVSSMPKEDSLPGMRLASQISQSEKKVVWVWTRNREVMQAAVEAGWSTFMFGRSDREIAMNWATMSVIEPMFIEGSFVYDVDGSLVACIETVSSGTDLMELTQMAGQTHTVIMNTKDWMSIPAENVVAAFQGTRTPVLVLTSTSNESRVMLEALERGTNGVVLRTDNPEEITFLKNYLETKTYEKKSVALSPAKVVRIEPAGMGERVCVDLCCLLKPGEGLLVGSFARTLFLVHSECLESEYISSRPFRVNAGPVHAYVGLPGGKTAYLSELRSGTEILIVDANGNSHSAVVGRVKIELRPLILIEAEIESNGEWKHSLLLQNAETVRLVAPAGGRAVSVSELRLGDHVLVSVQDTAARHAGVKISEHIVER